MFLHKTVKKAVVSWIKEALDINLSLSTERPVDYNYTYVTDYHSGPEKELDSGTVWLHIDITVEGESVFERSYAFTPTLRSTTTSTLVLRDS